MRSFTVVRRGRRPPEEITAQAGSAGLAPQPANRHAAVEALAGQGLGLPWPLGQAGDLQVQALLQPLPGGRADRAVVEEPG